MKTFPILNLRGAEPRHACDQGDKLDSYTWTEYDAREGGVQVIKDSLNNVKLTTEFLKVAGGAHGGSWAARIRGEPINQGIQLPQKKLLKIKLELPSKAIPNFDNFLFWTRGSWWIGDGNEWK